MADFSRGSGKEARGAGPTAVTEIERKFDVPAGFQLPELAGVAGVAQVGPPVVHHLEATYFDTPDLRLVTNRITLRRRTGGDDAGWHLKRPRKDGDRDELHAPLGEVTETIPAALLTPVAVHLRSAPLSPVVRLTTVRTVHRLLDDDGTVLVEVAQDEVSAVQPGRGEPPAGVQAETAGVQAETAGVQAETAEKWSELEVELVSGDRALLEAVADRVIAAGAVPSASVSKLARALGDVVPAPRAPRPAGVRKGSASDVLLTHLRRHVERLKAVDPLVRADQHDAVHQMRVAARRLRSALATFRPLVDRGVTEPIRGELQWLGVALAVARDAEVTRDHLRGLVEAQPPHLVRGPVVERITTSMEARYRAAHDEALVDLDTPRYFALLDALDGLVNDPPVTRAARGKADDVLLPLVVKTFRRVRRLVRAAEAEQDPGRRDELLHEVRKAAKRARYAGESLVPAYGRVAKLWAGRMEDLQEALGAHQDTVVIREKLLLLTEEAAAAGEDTFTYGRLHGLEEKRAADTENLFDVAWAAAQAKAVHRWLVR